MSKELIGKVAGHIKSMLADSHGGATMQTAMLFGAIALALTVLVTPQLKSAADTYAENRALGIDHVMTGSIKKTKTYTVRKSVLDK